MRWIIFWQLRMTFLGEAELRLARVGAISCPYTPIGARTYTERGKTLTCAYMRTETKVAHSSKEMKNQTRKEQKKRKDM
jgi:hypothetical protein